MVSPWDGIDAGGRITLEGARAATLVGLTAGLATLEAAAFLVLAERYRSDGDWTKAKIFVANAVDNLPSHAVLRTFEKTFNGAELIRWRIILLPASKL